MATGDWRLAVHQIFVVSFVSGCGAWARVRLVARSPNIVSRQREKMHEMTWHVTTANNIHELCCLVALSSSFFRIYTEHTHTHIAHSIKRWKNHTVASRHRWRRFFGFDFTNLKHTHTHHSSTHHTSHTISNWNECKTTSRAYFFCRNRWKHSSENTHVVCVTIINGVKSFVLDLLNLLTSVQTAEPFVFCCVIAFTINFIIDVVRIANELTEFSFSQFLQIFASFFDDKSYMDPIAISQIVNEIIWILIVARLLHQNIAPVEIQVPSN